MQVRAQLVRRESDDKTQVEGVVKLFLDSRIWFKSFIDSVSCER